MSPSFYNEGRTPRQHDTRLRRWKKIAGYYADSTGLAGDIPRIKDTLRVCVKKVNQALTGV